MDDSDRRLLQIATAVYRHEGVRMNHLGEIAGSPTRAWQRINQLIDTEEALAVEPVRVGILRRRRARNLVG